MWIERPPKWFRAFFPGALFRIASPGDSGRKSVYITFDDGPIPEATPWILDELDKYGVKATFFMVGQNVERYPGLYAEVVGRGHVAANHTLHHMKGLGKSVARYEEDADAGAQVTGSKIFRPPHGFIRRSQLKALAQKYLVVMYDLVTRDYSKRCGPKDVVNNVKRYARDGSIIVFHDSLKSIHKLKTALPECLEWLRNQGYEFKVIESDIKEGL